MLNKLNEQGFYLNTEQQVALGASAFGDFLQIFPTYAAGKATQQSYNFQAWQLNQNAELLRADAQDILNQSYEQENKVRIEGMKVRGEQRAAMSASGFEVDSSSYRDMIGNTDYNIARNTLAIRREAMTKYAATKTKADLADIQADYQHSAGKLAKKRAKKEAILSGVTGALKLGAMSYFGDSENMGRSPSGLAPLPSRKPTLGE